MKFTNVFVGTVGHEPRSGAFDDGRAWANVRIAVNHDYFNGATGEVVSRGVSWFDVNAYGALAKNMAYCVHKGDSIIVVGELRLRDWEKEGRTGTSGTIVADVVGPNLLFGVAKFVSSSTLTPTPDPEGDDGEGDGSGGSRTSLWEKLGTPPADGSKAAVRNGTGGAGGTDSGGGPHGAGSGAGGASGLGGASGPSGVGDEGGADDAAAAEADTVAGEEERTPAGAPF